MKPYHVSPSSAKPIHHCTGVVVLTGYFYSVQTTFGRYDNVASVVGRCNLKDEVYIQFGDPKNRRHPIIVYKQSKVVSEARRKRTVVYPSALWSQLLSSSGLHPFVSPSFAPDPTASTISVWSGNLGIFADFPMMLDKDLRPVLGFAVRKLDNSNWDKIRVAIVTSSTTELVFETNWEGSDTVFGSFIPGFAAITADANIVFISEANKNYGWRKRGGLLEKVTFSGRMTNHGVYLANMSDIGQLVFPNYSKQPGGTISYLIELFAEVGAPATVTSTEGSTTNKIQFYDLSQESPIIPNLDFDPASLLTGYTHPVIDSFIGNLPFNASAQLVTWASGRDAFRPNSTGFERAATIGFVFNSTNGHYNSATGLTDYSNQSFFWGKKLKAVVAAVSGVAAAWVHEIEVIPEDPILNTQLYTPFDSVFATQTGSNRFTDDNDTVAINYPTLSWRPYGAITYSGVCPSNRLTTNQAIYPGYPLGSGGLLAFSFSAVEGGAFPSPATPISRGHWTLPQYDHFKDVKIELLPRGRNLAVKTKHDLDPTKLLNWNVFEDWSAPTAQPHGSLVVKRTDNSVYLAYTTPRQCFFGGVSTLTGSISQLKNTVPFAFAEVIFDRLQSTDLVEPYADDPDHTEPFYFDWDQFQYPQWTNGGGASLYGIGVSNSFFSGPIATVECFLVRSQSYLSRRYLRKISSTGALIWEKDMTQLMAGASHWMTKLQLGVRLSGAGGDAGDMIGAVSSEELPLGDDMGPPRPCGRVVFQWVDFHTLGPNFLPTQKLCIYDDANGNLLHALALSNAEGGESPTEVLIADVHAPDGPPNPDYVTEYFTGDGSTTDFTLAYTPDEIDSVTVDGDPTEYTLGGATVTISPAPADGAAIEIIRIIYEPGDPGELRYEAGNRRWDPVVQEIYTGTDPNTREWALITINLEDRQQQESTIVSRTLRIKMGTNIAVAPSVEWIGGSLGEVAIHGGSIYSCGTVFGSNFVKKTNPSTV